MPESRPIYFMVGDQARGIYSHAWRIWWSRASFYIKPKWNGFAQLKISLHGPDSKNRGDYFKIGRDLGAGAGSAPVQDPSGVLPMKFTGREVAEGVRHVITMRSAWDMFAPGVPSAPLPRFKGKDNAAFLIEAPSPGFASDVELYVSDRGPFFGSADVARDVRLNSAGFGPIFDLETKRAITGVSRRRSVLASPTPPGAMPPPPISREDARRGIGFDVDENQVLWVCDQLMTSQKLVPGAPMLAPRPYNWQMLDSRVADLTSSWHLPARGFDVWPPIPRTSAA